MRGAEFGARERRFDLDPGPAPAQDGQICHTAPWGRPHPDAAAREAWRPPPGAPGYALVVRALPLALLLSLGACDKGGPVEPRVDGRYYVARDTPFFDSGCAQDRLPDGKLKKKTRFTLLSTQGQCWNIKLDDEDEVYIHPDHVRAEP